MALRDTHCSMFIHRRWIGQAANFVRKRNILAQHELRAESFVVCGTPHR